MCIISAKVAGVALDAGTPEFPLHHKTPVIAVTPAELEQVATALKTMKRANGGLTWVQQSHAQQFFRRLSNSSSISHESIDACPGPRFVNSSGAYWSSTECSSAVTQIWCASKRGQMRLSVNCSTGPPEM